MTSIEILNIIPVSERDRARIEAVDGNVRLTDAGGWFDGEIRETWPAYTANRYVAVDAEGQGSRAERDALLAGAEIIIGGWPFPLDLRARAQSLKWFHQRPAGASNLLRGDLWESDVMVTTSRGLGNTLAIAEYTIAGMFHFAKGLHRVAVDSARQAFDFRAYRAVQLAGKTVCVVGAGGIGQEVGRLAAALGMRVVGTRRTPGELPEGFSEMRGTDGLHDLLAESDFVAVCAHWTPETEKLIGTDAFAAMKDGAVVLNVARGEIIDEAALLDALEADKIRGAVLDVYVGEFEHAPDPKLWVDPRVLITPHTSGGSDVSQHRAIDLFCENLRLYIDGKPLLNVIDWARGY